MKKLLVFLTVLVLVCAINVHAATELIAGGVTCDPIGGYLHNTDLGDDSAGFYHSYCFDVPEGCRSDSLVLFVYVYSEDGAVDVDITSEFGFRKTPPDPVYGNRREISDYVWEIDSTAVVSTLATESVTMPYTLVPTTVKPLYDAVRINVKGGGANNRADTVYFIKIRAPIGIDKWK